MNSPIKYGHVLRAISASPWAIYRPTFDLIMAIAEMRAAGEAFTPDEIAERLSAASKKNGPRTGAQRSDYVAVIPIYGVISQRQNIMSQTSGGTSIDGLKGAFREALNDPEVGHIVFDIDSPGGTVDGVAELADEIRAARGEKPMTSVVNTAMFSAALWLGSQADEVVAMPTGQMGSIGIISTHTDDTAAREREGIRRTVIAMPPGKADGWGGDPLSEDGMVEIREMQEELYGMFTGAVSKGRNAPIATVRDVWGQNARIFSAKAAHKNGLIDRIDTLDATIAKAARQLHSGPASQAAGAQKLGFFGRDPLTRQQMIEAGLFKGDGNQAVAEPTGVYADGMADGHGSDPAPDETPAGTEAEPQGTGDDESAAVLADQPLAADLGGMPFAQRLVLVAGEAEALGEHARRRAAIRAEEGRGLSEETWAQIQRIQHAFDGLDLTAEAEPEPVTAEAGEAAPEETPAPRRGLLALYEEAASRGYHLPT